VQGQQQAVIGEQMIAQSELQNAYQVFNRRLGKPHVDVLQKEWSRKLGLKFTPKSLAYMAHRICALEAASRGRLATTIEDVVLRALVASAVKNKDLRVLEIGTLFGLGLAAIYEHAHSRFNSVHLTAIDPLDGYYGKDARDIVTDENIDERTFRSNLMAAGIPDQDYTLIKMMSTEDSAIEAASKQLHDLLIIDGDHSYAGIAADYVNYLPAVKRGGYIIFDDYGSPDWPDVMEFVDTAVRNDPHVALVGVSWRTAVFRVIRKPPAIKGHTIATLNPITGKRSGTAQD
jgi:predicted O-methyltransferase YrrM